MEDLTAREELELLRLRQAQSPTWFGSSLEPSLKWRNDNQLAIQCQGMDQATKLEADKLKCLRGQHEPAGPNGGWVFNTPIKGDPGTSSSGSFNARMCKNCRCLYIATVDDNG